MDIPFITSLVLGVLGIAVAVYQGFEKKKLTNYLRSQSWHIYSMANISSSSLQMALKSYKENYKDRIDPVVFENLSKCDAYNTSLFLESIRQIQLSEPQFSMENIMSWQLQGKIIKEHSIFFYRMLPSIETSNIFCFLVNSFSVKIRSKLVNYVKSPKAPQQDNKPM